MDMKNYNFKDSRKLFRWLYYSYGLSAINQILFNLFNDYPIRIMTSSIIIYVIIVLIIYLKTNQNILVDERYIKATKTSPYMMITKITATTDILIWCDSNVSTIKVIDFKNNYSKYKELMKYVYSKVEKDTVLECATVNELLKKIYENKQCKLNITFSSTTGKPVLGGWLKFWMVMAWFGAISMLLSIFALITSKFDLTMLNMAAFGVIQFLVLILLYKRKKVVKYALAAMPVLSAFYGLIASIVRIVEEFSAISLSLNTIYIVIGGLSSYFMAKVYIDYIDNFDRPKQTLIN